MKKSEISELITMARAFDDRVEEVAPPRQDPADPSRIIEDARVIAWHLILGDIDYELACRGLAELYQEPQMMRLQPGHVYQAAEKVRRRNVAAADLARLEPPQELAVGHGERSLMPLWRQEAVRAIGLGRSIEDAQQIADDSLGVSRRLLGPTRPRPVLDMLRGESA